MRTFDLLRAVAIVVLLCVTVSTVSGNPKRIKEQSILKQILDENKYDKRIRAYGKTDTDPTKVTVNTYVRSIERLNDVKMEFKVQLTFRMQWLDTRLNYISYQSSDQQSNLTYLTLAGSASKKIWTPDLFFANEKEGHTHDMLLPNEYTRIYPDGSLLVSQRITLTLACPMTFRYYPFDRQVCSIRMASYGWTTEDVIFAWKNFDPIQITSELHLPQFSLQNFSTDYCDSHTNTGVYSCLRVDFVFTREFSYYLVQIYIPIMMMVIIAWLSFFLDHKKPNARVTLTTLTLLICAVMTAIINAQIPRVSYTKPVDVWTGISLTFIFVALVEGVLANWLHRREKVNKDTELEDKASASLRKHESEKERFQGLPLPEQMDYVFRIFYVGFFILFNIIYWPMYKS